jgi:hypothetical protein
MGDNVRSARTLSHHQFISKLKCMQPDLYDELIFKEEYVKNYDKIILGTKYGDVKISPNLLLRGVYPCISNAINPKEYILNYIKINNFKLYDKIIEIQGDYKGVMNKINIQTIYGVVNITPDNIDEIMLCQIPGVSSVAALSIIEKFKNLPNLIKEMEKNVDCLKDISTINTKGQMRKINKTSISNIVKFLLKK